MNTNEIEWDVVVRWAGEKIASAREANDNPSLDDIETALIRGRIRALKELIALPQSLEAARLAESVEPPLY